MVVSNAATTPSNTDTVISNADIVVSNDDMVISNGDMVVSNSDIVVSNIDITVSNADIIASRAAKPLNYIKIATFAHKIGLFASISLRLPLPADKETGKTEPPLPVSQTCPPNCPLRDIPQRSNAG
jgi:hypothetical protein